MAGKTTFLEKNYLNAELRGTSTAVSGSNASTTNLLVTSSTGFAKDWIVLVSATGTYHRVTAIPDGTHITVTPATPGAATTTGTVANIAYAPIGIWIAAFTAAPSDAGGGTEAAYGGYARVQLTQADATWAAPSGGPSSTSNSAVVNFPISTGSGSTLTHYAAMDAVSGGNMLWWAVLGTAQAIGAAGITPSFAIGALTRSED